MGFIDMAERLVAVRTPTDLAIGPDGRSVAFGLNAVVAEAGSHLAGDLWMLSLEDPEHGAVRLTDGAWSDALPTWSPDGRRLAFLSDRRTPGQHLPYTTTLGEQPVLAATLTGSAESVAWSADGERLLVMAADQGLYGLDFSARAVMWASPVPDPEVITPGTAWRRLFLVDLATGDVQEVGPVGASIWEVDWDGESTVVAIASDDPRGAGWYHARLVALDLTDGTERTLYRPSWQLEGLALAPDGRHVAVVEGYSSDPGLVIGSIRVLDLHTGATSDPWPDLETVGLVGWIDERSLWYARIDRTGTAAGRVWLDGRREEAWAGPAFIGGNVVKPQVVVGKGPDSVERILTTHEAHGVPPEIARFDPATASWTRLTTFNDDLVADAPTWPTAEVMRWNARDGQEIEGWLMRPPGATGPLPLVLAVHGGPTWCWNAYFSDSEPNGVVLADAGFAVLLPNPRGSTGRGHAFKEAVLGDPGGVDFGDVMAGVDACIERGIADPARLGIAGLSYGGYMAAWAVGQTDRFGAAVAMSVVADYRSFHLTSEVAPFDEMILDGRWDDIGGAYTERSPVTHAHRCVTPTLVTAGALDRCTPVEQGQQLYAALADSEAGEDAELVIYPREGHVLVERTHALDQIRRTTAWFDRHLAANRTP
jgi:dipeptidyl aminopeptidase/acylaminoacyl peptidase